MSETTTSTAEREATLETLKPASEYNLDAMSIDELTAFAVAIDNGVRPLRAARQLFPGRKAGTVRAAKDLRAYAWNKLTAMSCRMEGKIDVALQYEAICDKIYGQLPDWAKGW